MSTPTTAPPRSVAEIEQDLEQARARQREENRKAAEAAEVQADRRRQREDLTKELDQRELQIKHTELWLAERRADAKALAERIRTEFADLKDKAPTA